MVCGLSPQFTGLSQEESGLQRCGPSFIFLTQDYLRMVATQPILEGHEIFNTYGQMANWQLIHMYGFAEPYPNNTDDTADIQMVTVRDAALQGASAHPRVCIPLDSGRLAGVDLSSIHPLFYRNKG